MIADFGMAKVLDWAMLFFWAAGLVWIGFLTLPARTKKIPTARLGWRLCGVVSVIVWPWLLGMTDVSASWPWLLIFVLWEDRRRWRLSGHRSMGSGGRLIQAAGLALILATTLVSLGVGWHSFSLFPRMEQWVGQSAYHALVGGGPLTVLWLVLAQGRTVRQMLWPWLTVTIMGVCLGDQTGWSLDSGWVVGQWLLHALWWATFRHPSSSERWILWACSITVSGLYVMDAWPLSFVLVSLVSGALASDIVQGKNKPGPAADIRPFVLRLYHAGDVFWSAFQAIARRKLERPKTAIQWADRALLALGKEPLAFLWFGLTMAGFLVMTASIFPRVP